ncbi:MAG: triose-phosphate isomerase [Nanoarchaeota archaeon]
MKPVVIINFKTYKSGADAVNLAKEIRKIDKKIIIGVQTSDLFAIKKSVDITVYSESIDPYRPGRNTGYVTPEAVKKVGASGTFLNHSEHKLSFETLKKDVKRCREAGIKAAVFASSLKAAIKIKRLKPDYIIIEPPELVAGKVSVSQARPGLIKDIAKKLKYKFLVGAGIHTNEDVKLAMKLGASGIAVSSAITTAKNPEKKLRELIG